MNNLIINILYFSWLIEAVSGNTWQAILCCFSVIFNNIYIDIDIHTYVHIFLCVYFRWPEAMSEGLIGHEDQGMVTEFLKISSNLLVPAVRLAITFRIFLFSSS